jgi:hypothetical protein
MAKLYNLARMTTATTGTGTITLGSAVASYLSFASSGVQDGDTVTYAIVDGSNREIGRGVYTASGTTLTRTVLESTNSNTAINLSGSAEVFITAAGEDITSDVQITGGSISGITDLPIADGGTGKSTASAAANALDGYLTIAASGGTTTLDNTSSRTIVVTGSTTHTIVLPVVSTLALGWTFVVSNTSTGFMSFQSSGLNSFPNTLPANMAARFVCVAITGTGTASWNFVYIGSTGRTGAGSLVFGTNPTFTTSILTPLASGGTAASSTLTLQSTTGAGTTDAIIFNTGSQSERLRINTSGAIGLAGSNFGTSGQVLTSGGSGATPSWLPKGMTLISALSASGTNPIASGLTLTSYRTLMIVIEGVTQNAGANRGFLIGTSTADDLAFTSNVFNATTARGIMWIDLNAGTMTAVVESVAAGASAPAANSSTTYIANLPFTTASTAISFALSGTGSFNAGTFRIYGLS